MKRVIMIRAAILLVLCATVSLAVGSYASSRIRSLVVGTGGVLAAGSIDTTASLSVSRADGASFFVNANCDTMTVLLQHSLDGVTYANISTATTINGADTATELLLARQVIPTGLGGTAVGIAPIGNLVRFIINNTDSASPCSSGTVYVQTIE